MPPDGALSRAVNGPAAGSDDGRAGGGDGLPATLEEAAAFFRANRQQQ